MALTHSVTPTPDLNAADVEWALTQAGRAPSIHNTQPWRFEWDRPRFTLRADTTRGLTMTDPDGRELVISCGAALFNLRLALRKLGRRGTLTLLPDPTDPLTLAILTLTDALPATAEEQRLAEAIPRRHTHRGDFDDRPISPALAVRLQRAATAEGAELHYVHDPGQRRKIEHLARDAELTQSANDRVREELAAWTPMPGSPRRDGIPITAYPASNTHGATVATRDFDAGRGIGGLDTPTPTPGLLLAILLTPQDLERDWLQARMSLEAVLTTAAEQWAFAALHSQVIEVAPLRAELRRELSTPAYPQLVLQLGHAGVASTTPRRPTTDIAARIA